MSKSKSFNQPTGTMPKNRRKPLNVKVHVMEILKIGKVKPWLMTTIGSFLILISTFVSGYIASETENIITKLSNQEQAISHKLNKSKRNSDIGITIQFLSKILYDIKKFSNFQDPETQSLGLRTHVAEMRLVILNMLQASGLSVDDDYLNRINLISDRIDAGDNSAMNDFYTILLELISKKNNYQMELLEQQYDIKTNIINLKNRLNKIKLIAFIL